MSDDNWMVCTMCRQTVRLNDIGICMHCQGKYDKHNQPDSWDNLHRCQRCGRGLPLASGHCGVCDDRDLDLFTSGFKEGR